MLPIICKYAKYAVLLLVPPVKCKQSNLNHCPQKSKKILNDPIHGSMEMHPACMAIINTPQFERLRHIKQLGVIYYVYPGAAHNRLEHSIGVCHLAGQFVRTLKENQPELDITEKDILCVEIAGLCHDLGHGPFSHLFDQQFVPRASNLFLTKDEQKQLREWKHEKASIDMLDYLIKENKLMEPEGILQIYDLDETDIIFIKELIYGKLKYDGKKQLEGRGEEKHFLYEIVSNKRTGIDVDKWDYLARDCHNLGIKNNFDHNRFMKFARVIKAKGPNDTKEVLQICIRDKEMGNLYNMFHARFTIHKIACQHRVTKVIDNMVATALIKANAELKIKGTGGIEFTMLECIHDMEAFSKLTDNVLLQILHYEGDSENMKEAKDIIKRIMSRDLDKFVCESGSLDRIEDIKDEEEKIIKEILQEYKETCGKHNVELQNDDLHIQFLNFDFGMEKRNPLKNLLVYTKEDKQKASQLDQDKVSRIIGPIVNAETFIRVMSRNRPNQVFQAAAESVLKKRKEGNLEIKSGRGENKNGSSWSSFKTFLGFAGIALVLCYTFAKIS